MDDGTDATPSSALRQALLAVLVVSPGQARSRKSLQSLFWGDLDGDRAAANLRTALYLLRQDLAAFGPDILLTDRMTIRPHHGRITAQEVERRPDFLEGLDLGLRGCEAFEDWLRFMRIGPADTRIEREYEASSGPVPTVRQGCRGLAWGARMSPEAEQSVRKALYRAALDPAEWPTVMARLGIAVGHVQTHLFEYDAARGGVVLSATAGYEPSYLDTFMAHYGAINPWAPGFAAAPVGKPTASAAMCADDIMRRSEFYAGWVRPQEDILGGGGIVLAQARGRAILFGGNIRQRDRDTVQPRWLDLVGRIGLDVRHALDVNRRLAELALDTFLLREGRNEAATAVLVLGRGQRVLWANPAGEALIAAGRLRIDIASQLAPLADPRLNDARSAAIAAARFAARGTRAVPLAPGIAAEVLPLDPRMLPLGPVSGIYGPLALVLAATGPPPPEALATTLAAQGLTAAEARVAIALAEGLSTTEIAGACGASVHTVNSQIMSALQKTGVRRHSQLVALVERLRR